MRTFVAIEVPGVRAAIGGSSSHAPEHLTLKFLGEVPEASVPGIGAALAEVAERTEAFPLTLAGIGGFPDLGRPRILFAEVAEGRAASVQLAADVRAALRPLGFTPEGRPFVPHVTILRVRSPRDRETAQGLLQRLQGRPIAATRIETLYLKASDLRPEGAVHRVVGSWPLRGAGLAPP